ncbi:MAG TPA: hydrogenase maturation protease [Alphaproteobacteria bacterium]|nr:hydrogenase maturation protease [Alphaproteobacteria bacterium]
MTALVIGIGHPDRGDDAVGPFVVSALDHADLPGLSTLCLQGDPADLMAAWEGRREVVVVDACSSGAPSGTVHRFNAVQEPLPADFGAVSTHGFGLAAAVELARAMGNLPASLTVYGIEASDFEPGAPLSPEVESAGRAVAAEIAHTIKEETCTKQD